MKLNTISKISIAFAVALSIAIPAHAAMACGSYGPPSDGQRISWAINADAAKAHKRKSGTTERRRILKLTITGNKATAVVANGWAKRSTKWDPKQEITMQMFRVQLTKKDGRWTVTKKNVASFAWLSTLGDFYKFKATRVAKL